MIFVEIREGLGGLATGFSEIECLYGSRPVEDSKANADLGDSLYGSQILNATGASQLSIEHLAEHCTAFLRLLEQPHLLSPLWTTVRCMLEVSARASWLLHPNVTTKERAGRALSVRFENVKQDAKDAENFGLPTKVVNASQASLNRIKHQAATLGIQVIQNSSRTKTLHVHAKPLGPTAFIESELGMGNDYGALSAIAHGNVHRFMRAAFKTFPKLEASKFQSKSLEKHLHSDSVWYLGRIALECFARPLWYKTKYYGWNNLASKELIEQAANKLRFPVERRFWKE